MTKEKKREIEVTGILVGFYIPAAEGITDVEGDLRITYKEPGFGLSLDNRIVLTGEELDLISTLRTALTGEPICQRLKHAEAPKDGE